jgi:AcrR family transcriptional regulator
MERRASQEDRRQRVIDVAFELGAEGGYEAVQMREVAATAGVALATIYRYFSSKDHLLAAAMTQWASQLRSRVQEEPPQGDTPADQLAELFKRACRAMERQPKLSMALVRALSAADPGVNESSGAVQRQIASMGDEILRDLDPQVRAEIFAVVGHVWYSTLVGWANGRRDFDWVVSQLEQAVHVLVDPHYS